MRSIIIRINKMIILTIIIVLLSIAQMVSADFQIIQRPAGAYGIAVTALNNNGQVVGFYGVPEDIKAFKWSNGEMETLESPEDKNICQAYDINDDGDVVGCCSEDFFTNLTACLWTDGVLIDLNEEFGLDMGTADGINNLGHIVGCMFTELGQRAYLLKEDELIDLGTLLVDEYPEYPFENGIAYEINNNDQVVGMSWCFIEDYVARAFTWTTDDGMTDLGVLPGYEVSYATLINDNGDIAGFCENMAFQTRAFLYTDEVGMIDLGTLPGATDSVPGGGGINNQGIIVGSCPIEIEGEMVDLVPFIWSGGEMRNLREIIIDVPGVINTADGINDHGQIAGLGFSPELGPYGFLWTPEEIEVRIDIRPWSKRNCINKYGWGLIPVAVFGSSDVNVEYIDLESLRLQGVLEIKTWCKKGKPLAWFNDLDRDGYVDLIALFTNEKGVFSDEDTTATLTGTLNYVIPIRGTDTICIFP